MKALLKKIIKFFKSKEKVKIIQPVSNSELLLDKVALITGGTGGIGYAIAQEYLRAGAKVVITGTNHSKVEECCKKLNSERVKGIELNLSDVTTFDGKIKEIIGLWNAQIDILVNCAGYNPNKDFFTTTVKDFDNTFNVNVKGTFFISQKIAKIMIGSHVKGHILNITSSSALRPAWSPYEMSKWTVKGLTVGLADALIPYGVIVNAIAPGPTATRMQKANDSSDLDYPSSPIGRMITPEEIANLATIFVSDMGNIVVGDTLYATGGSGVISLHR